MSRCCAGRSATPGERTHAETFYAGLDVHPVDYNPAVEAYREGRDPIAEPVPFHPSFEDRPGVPDRVFAAVSPELGDHLAAFWEQDDGERLGRGSVRAPPPSPDAAARGGAPRGGRHLPLVTHLHGTDLGMLDRIDAADSDEPEPAQPEWRLRRPLGASRLRARSPAAATAFDRHLASPARRGAPPARHRRRADRVDSERRRHRALRPRRPHRGGAACALAAVAGRRAARLGRVGRAGQHPLRRERPRAVRRQRRPESRCRCCCSSAASWR